MAFNRLADSQSKQLAALSVEHGGDTALTVNIGVSDGGREGNPRSQRSPPQSDSALGLGSSPKAARRTYLCFSALCHLYLHSAHGQQHSGRPTYNSVIPFSRLRTPTCPQQPRETLSKQLSAGRAQRAVHCPPLGPRAWQTPLVSGHREKQSWPSGGTGSSRARTRTLFPEASSQKADSRFHRTE